MPNNSILCVIKVRYNRLTPFLKELEPGIINYTALRTIMADHMRHSTVGMWKYYKSTLTSATLTTSQDAANLPFSMGNESYKYNADDILRMK